MAQGIIPFAGVAWIHMEHPVLGKVRVVIIFAPNQAR